MEKRIDGKIISTKMKEEIGARVSRLIGEHEVVPGLAVVLVGTDPASIPYVTSKRKTCLELGIASFAYDLPEDTTEEEILDLIRELNTRVDVHGILVQLPLPRHINDEKVILTIDPDKDVDGFHPMNIGRMHAGLDAFFPCTPYGIIKMLEYTNIETQGRHVVIVGRSNLVGKPVASLLLRKGKFADATVTVCHSKTPDLARHTRQADILIAAVGIPELITGDMVKEQVVIIDVGVNRVEDPSKKRGFRLVGDVDYASTYDVCSYITPVPGGVGPMTITMLMYNTMIAAERSIKAPKES